MKKLFITTLLSGLLAAGTAMACHHGDKSYGKQCKNCKVRMMFYKLDKNGDGEVTRAEQRAHADEMFVMMDANGNGRVTLEEAKAGMKKMKKEWKAKHKDKHRRMSKHHDGEMRETGGRHQPPARR
ncbi:MAG: EF-hand domain-containing protein [Ketobacter sp.]|nr:EF-hand domain-containing protein [Ketobacter sp.]